MSSSQPDVPAEPPESPEPELSVSGLEKCVTSSFCQHNRTDAFDFVKTVNSCPDFNSMTVPAIM